MWPKNKKMQDAKAQIHTEFLFFHEKENSGWKPNF